MQIEQLILFRTIAREKNISVAARLCHVSQPAATKQIQRLEDELGLQLLIRNNRGIELTEAGELFVAFATRVSDLYESMSERLHEWRHQRQTIDIAASPVIAHYVIPCCLCRLKEDDASVTFNIQAQPTDLIVDKVLATSVDVGIGMNIAPQPELMRERLFQDDVVLAASPYHPIASHVTIDQLREHLLVMQDEKHRLYHMVAQWFKKQHYYPESFRKFQKFDSLEAIKSLIINGCGVAIVPRRAVLNELNSGTLREVSLENMQLSYTMYVVWRKDHPLDPRMNDLLQSIRGLFIA